MQVGVAESNHTHLWLLSDMFTIGETGVAMGTLFKPLCPQVLEEQVQCRPSSLSRRVHLTTQ